MLDTLCFFEMLYTQSAMQQDRPDFFLLELSFILISCFYLIGQAVVNKLKHQYNLVKCWAKCIVNFSVGLLHIQNVFIFLS
jgi:hypothetical protein